MTCASTSLRISVIARCAATPSTCEFANAVVASTMAGLPLANAADEIAVEAFLQGRIAFPSIYEIVADTLSKMPARTPASTVALLARATTAEERALGKGAGAEALAAEAVAGADAVAVISDVFGPVDVRAVELRRAHADPRHVRREVIPALLAFDVARLRLLVMHEQAFV